MTTKATPKNTIKQTGNVVTFDAFVCVRRGKIATHTSAFGLVTPLTGMTKASAASVGNGWTEANVRVVPCKVRITIQTPNPAKKGAK